MGGWLNLTAQFLNLWAIRIAVLSSFAAHLVLLLLAGVRRRKASGGRTLLLWLAYQLANWAAVYSLGNLSFGSTSQEQQLVAFWAPFLLQHLGGPDNISAYSLEDNVLCARQAISVAMQVGGATYVLYKHIYMGGGAGALLPASIIIFAVGVAKYVEKALALRGGNLANIRSSSKKKQHSRSALITTRRDELDDERALEVAHNMFPFCRRAMVDSSVDMNSSDLDASRKIFSFGWESMCKVVEMELSLMYDILYTKAGMVHTWGGYLIRSLSPLATAVAFFLFLFYSKDGQRRADVIITYALLVAAFLLDITWLFRALGSTWTRAFLQARRRSWIHRAVLSSGRWRRLRQVVVSMDLGRLLLPTAAHPPTQRSYRTWTGAVGQYNLLHEVTRDTTSLRGRAAKKIELEESRGVELSDDVKRLLFERVREILKSTYKDSKDRDASYSMNDITTYWGQDAARRRHKKLKRFRLGFGREFQEDILVWHIGTQVFLSSIDGTNAAKTTRAKAIKVLSEYLMFLVAVRRQMLPGLALRSLYEATIDVLQVIWRDEAGAGENSTTGENRIARILRTKTDADRGWGLEHGKTRLVTDGANIALTLLRADPSEMPELLELVFNVWVDKLLYAGTRCSRESHAKQLSRGGELTTIVWILAEHAGPFQIGLRSQDHEKLAAKKQEEPKKSDGVSLEPPKRRPPPPGASGQPKGDKPKDSRDDRDTMTVYTTLYGVD
jgi:hypothetical protein